jgi:diaminohydroxyphosphoribosylaminopyrimidine deaminase/5-amino-6-(5-phosphoribosylamino)uracil reductase
MAEAVRLKLAVSVDERSRWRDAKPIRITGEGATARVHLMRATSDAVLTGIGSGLSDDPLPDCRLPGMEKRSPVRVVLDTMLRHLPLTSRLAQTARQTPLWVMAGEGAAREREQALAAAASIVLRVSGRATGSTWRRC